MSVRSLDLTNVRLNSRQQFIFTKRFSQILVRTDDPAFGFIKQTIFRRQHNHWRRFEFAIVFDQGAGLITIETRHHNVDKNNIGAGIGNFCQGIKTIGRGN